MMGMLMDCPGCEMRVLDTAEGHLVESSGIVHDCDEWRAPEPEPDRERCEYTIQRPAPIPTHEPKGLAKYPWAQMEPGDMFLVPCDPDNYREVMSRVQSAGHYYYHQHRDGRYTIMSRRVKRGVRVWLVETAEEAS